MTVSIEHFLADIGEDRRVDIEVGAAEIVAEQQTLAALRKARGLTQAQIAAALDTSQANVAQIERKSDARISTVARVIRAMGGRLQLIAEFDGGTSVPLAIGQDGEIALRVEAAGKQVVNKVREVSAAVGAERRQASRLTRNELLTAHMAEIVVAKGGGSSSAEHIVPVGHYSGVDLSSADAIINARSTEHLIPYRIHDVFDLINKSVADEGRSFT